ncbi:MAG: vitamin K epoxide reductase family protein, partial [Actinomycetota bacterium]|nr:vitamin K epoxide reductase family protein [Actinomycetota bacterium]
AARTGGAAQNGGTGRAGARAKTGPAARNDVLARNGTSGGGAGRGGSRGRAPQDELTASTGGTGPALWLQLTTFVLALAGLGVSIYLTIAHFTESALAGCSESGLVNCTKVTTSAQSYVFGIPVAVLGLAFYLFAVAIMSPWAWRAARREVHMVRIASLVVGIGFVLYLIYAELLIIGSICLYCTSVHAITFVLFVLTMGAVAVWGLKPGAPWTPRFGGAAKETQAQATV